MPTAKPHGGVDCHAHVFSADAPAAPGARYRPAYAATVDAWMAQWHSTGVTRGVLVQPSFFGTDNREMVAALKAHPETLRGVAVVDAGVSDALLDTLHEAGVRAIRLNLQGISDYDIFSRTPWPGLFARIGRRGWHVEAFVEAGRAPELLRTLARTEVPLVLDHFANPGTDPKRADATFDAVAAAARERGVTIKLSGPYRLGGADAQALARRWIETLGHAHLVWGSDWPWTRHEHGRDYAAMRAELDRWAGAEGSAAIVRDNPARLYSFTS